MVLARHRHCVRYGSNIAVRKEWSLLMRNTQKCGCHNTATEWQDYTQKIGCRPHVVWQDEARDQQKDRRPMQKSPVKAMRPATPARELERRAKRLERRGNSIRSGASTGSSRPKSIDLPLQGMVTPGAKDDGCVCYQVTRILLLFWICLA